MKTDLNPVITAIIPTYRRPEQLKHALGSVLKQTYPHIKIHVLDNASGDGTADLVREYSRVDPRIQYICHKENIGAFENFQFGMKRVDTPFFAFLSDDDIVLPDFYETAMAMLEKHPQAMFCATNVFRIGSNDCIMPMPLDRWRSGIHDPPEGFLSFVRHGHPEWTGTLFRAEVRSSIGLLDRATGKYSDLDYVLRLSARHSFCIIKKPCAVFDGSQGDIRAPYRFEALRPCLLKMLKNIETADKLDEDLKRFAIRHYMDQYESSLFRTGLLYLVRGYQDDTRKIIQEMYARKRRSGAFLLNALMQGRKHMPGVAELYKKLALLRRRAITNKAKNHVKLPMSAWWGMP